LIRSEFSCIIAGSKCT